MIGDAILREAAAQLLASSTGRRYMRQARRLAIASGLEETLRSDADQRVAVKERVWDLLRVLSTESERTESEFETAILLTAFAQTPTFEVVASVRQFLKQVRARPLPWSATVNRCTFRFGLDLGLEESWADQFRELLEAALRVRVAA